MPSITIGDDQIALAFCFGAVLISGLVMYFSHHVRMLTQRVQSEEVSRLEQLRLMRSRQVERELRNKQDRAA